MKSKLFHGYSEEQIFKNKEDQDKILSMTVLEREKIIADRVMKLKEEDERKKLLNEKDNKNNESKKDKAYFNEESDSEEAGEIKEHKKHSRHKKTFDSKDEESSLSVGEDEDEKQIKKESENVTLEDMKKIVLTRNFFEKYYFYPNFDENVKGAFIRVNFSWTGDSSQPVYTGGYQIEEIEQIITKDKAYDFAGNKCTKNIKIKNSEDTVNFMVISNSDILEEEFNKLKSGEKTNVPTMEKLISIQKNIDDIRNKELTPEEMNDIITKKRKDRIKYKDTTLNVTEELDRAMEQYYAMNEEYEEQPKEKKEEGREAYLKKKKELEDDINQLKKMKEERDNWAKMNYENDIVAKINEDIKEKRKIDERISMLSKKRKNALNDKEHKLFQRVDCHPTNLFESADNDKDALNLIKKETSDFIENKKTNKKKSNFSYAKRIRQFKDFIESKKSLIDDMMENEKKKNEELIIKEDNNEENKEEKKVVKGIIDMSQFFNLASINYDMYNKMIKDQNKQNTKDPEIKILRFDEYLNENKKE